MAPVPHPYDIVITSNSGYPLDLNLYQAVKGMSAAAQVVRPGGAIIIAAECWDGIPEHGLFGELLREAEQWIMTDDDQWVFSFRNVCSVLGVNAEYIRRGVLAEKARHPDGGRRRYKHRRHAA